jgi:hypothetical protein
LQVLQVWQVLFHSSLLLFPFFKICSIVLQYKFSGSTVSLFCFDLATMKCHRSLLLFPCFYFCSIPLYYCLLSSIFYFGIKYLKPVLPPPPPLPSTHKKLETEIFSILPFLKFFTNLYINPYPKSLP